MARSGSVRCRFLLLGSSARLTTAASSASGQDGSLGIGVTGLYEDGKGNLWAGVRDGLWRWRPGPPRFYSARDQPDGIRGLAEGDDGALLIAATGSGLLRLVDGKIEPYPLQGSVRQFDAWRVLRDRDGGLWIGTRGQGLVHIHRGRTDVFARSDGLSSELVASLFEDREGNIWGPTVDGLDRFREFAVPTLSVKQGLSNPFTWAVLAARDGRVWLGRPGA